MQILLTTLNAKYIHMNLAVRLLYTLNHDNPGLHWREFTIRQPAEEIADACLHYEVVAFSCYIWNITQTLQVATLLKQKKPAIKILLGGPEVSYEWQSVIELPVVDYIIVGEGEIPFRQFLQNYPNTTAVQSLAYKTNGHVFFNPEKERFSLSELSGKNPYQWDDTESLKYKVSYIETSRGCPYKCAFCLASLDNNVRYLPTADIKANLQYLMQHGKVIKFLDRTFNMKRDFTLDIFQFILDHHQPGNVFQFEITADILHPDIIKFIQEHVPPNLFRFEIGIQTVNQQANLQVQRKQNFDKTKSIIYQVQNKVELHLDLIVGLPLDYLADVVHSFDEVFKLFAPELQLGFLKFLKGTPVRENYREHGYEFEQQAPYQIIKSNYLSQQDLATITIVEEALEIYWNKPRAIRTLKMITGLESTFQFLWKLGLAFQKQSNFHLHHISDVYQILFRFLQTTYRNPYLQQLAYIDYLSYFNRKPNTHLLPVFSKSDTIPLLKKAGIHLQKSSAVILPIAFNWTTYCKTGECQPGNALLIFVYDGKNNPTPHFVETSMNYTGNTLTTGRPKQA